MKLENNSLFPKAIVVEEELNSELERQAALREKGLDRSLAEVEQKYILSIVNVQNNNLSRAASVPGIDRKTLSEKLKSYKLNGLWHLYK